ncbi:NUDIX hydrolase [Pelagovum pacificum]|uniref:NUDIX hydrolase n=1 Tax=Pelagovum pacificum TaxID=2588711 RepID=A0A5C5GLY8_9RHOB|nr:NUDIX domain-containing protein [Pelagovum pacificum]QQA44425.1 NUDIX hydrolase [Pelagovum pacificum]TNY34306.1 NUDIX hydrolase [Pelagovum pacificum]
MLTSIWTDYIAPMLRRPPRFQVAALCHRAGDAGPEVLMITSRETKRWILPKGWPKKGYDAAGAALEEAWEEAGVKSRPATPRRIGDYRYTKRLTGGVPVETQVAVFAIEVDKLYEQFPEVSERERRWYDHAEAADLVDEDGLRDLLRDLPALIGTSH